MSVDARVGFVYPFWGEWFDRSPDYSMDIIGAGLATSLPEHGLQPGVFIRGGRKKAAQWRAQGVDYRLVPRRFDWRWMPGRLPRRIASQLSFLAYATGAARFLRAWRPDVVHVYIFDEMIPLLRRLVGGSVPIVLHMHDHRQILNATASARRLGGADLIVGCSEFITNQAVQQFPSLADRFTTVLNGTPVERFDSPPTDGGEPIRLLYVGRLSPEKGVHTLVQAFSYLRGENRRIQLDIVGPSNLAPFKSVSTESSRSRLEPIRRFWMESAYDEHLRDLTSDIERGAVRFHGSLPHEDLPKVFERADIVVFPSIWDEPFGLPVIEAMAAGKPVVASAVGGVPETVEDGATGVLFPPGDVPAMIASIKRLLDNGELRQSMGAAGRRAARNRFSWSRYVDDWIGIYDRVTRSSSSARWVRLISSRCRH